MRHTVALAALVAVLSTAPVSWATLSGNLFPGGDFENTAYLKNNYTYDGEGNPVGAHRFNADLDTGDWGLWIGFWGLQDLEQNGYYGLGGFSTHDYPRGIGVTMQGVPGDVSDDRSNNNRSLDPYNPGSGNHIMETVAFYPSMGQWVKAPANQVPGPMTFSFDFYLNHWRADTSLNWFDRFEIRVYGSNVLPTHNVGVGQDFFDPTNGALEVTTPGAESKMLARFGWGNWWTNLQSWPGTNGWASLDSTAPTVWWDDVDSDMLGSVIIPTNLTQTYQYYSVTINTAIYGEEYYYFLIPGYGVNGWSATDLGTAIGFDNIDFRISVASTVLLADVNLDGARNALDISGFIQRVTSGTYQAEADCNQDGSVNALDIAKFIYYVTGGTGDAQAIPEPVTLGLLAFGLLALWRRDR